VKVTQKARTSRKEREMFLGEIQCMGPSRRTGAVM
jgi:hypothetical protein